MPRLDLETGIKICSKCKKEGSVNDFTPDKKRADGLYPQCHKCMSEYHSTWNGQHKAQIKAYDAARYAAKYEYMLLKGSRQRAKAKSLPFTITEADILVPEECPICGHFLERGYNSGINSSPSLDMWNPASGYVKGNVWIICHGCNRRKNDTPGDELIAFAFKCTSAFKEHCDRMA